MSFNFDERLSFPVYRVMEDNATTRDDQTSSINHVCMYNSVIHRDLLPLFLAVQSFIPGLKFYSRRYSPGEVVLYREGDIHSMGVIGYGHVTQSRTGAAKYYVSSRNIPSDSAKRSSHYLNRRGCLKSTASFDKAIKLAKQYLGPEPLEVQLKRAARWFFDSTQREKNRNRSEAVTSLRNFTDKLSGILYKNPEAIINSEELRFVNNFEQVSKNDSSGIAKEFFCFRESLNGFVKQMTVPYTIKAIVPHEEEYKVFSFYTETSFSRKYQLTLNDGGAHIKIQREPDVTEESMSNDIKSRMALLMMSPSSTFMEGIGVRYESNLFYIMSEVEE